MDSGGASRTHQHPLLRLRAQLEDALVGADDTHAWSLRHEELTELLPALTRIRTRVQAVELAVATQAQRETVGSSVGAGNTAAWWAIETGMRKPAAHALMKVAEALDDDAHAVTAQALARGEVLVEQARAIIDAVETLPTDLVDAELRARAEKDLVALAEHHDAKELRVLGRRILEVIAPEMAEEVEKRLLEREERRARESCRLSMRDDGQGSVHGRFKIPALEAAMLRKHLDALAAPRHRAATGEPVSEPATGSGRVSRPLRLGQAFCEYIRTREESGTPRAGGVAATVTVTMSLQSLLGADAAAHLDTGDRISAAEARRLACEAGIIPVVLGGRSEPLDVGRARRFHTKAQRVAIAHRDGGCATEGCDWPPGMCHVHHRTPWSHGGGTSVREGLMLCPRHHTIAHDARYQMRCGPSGKVTFNRRT
ncbi:MAG TPA: DUF222 domain-containing protein [Marmoricola sp.]